VLPFKRKINMEEIRVAANFFCLKSKLFNTDT